MFVNGKSNVKILILNDTNDIFYDTDYLQKIFLYDKTTFS